MAGNSYSASYSDGNASQTIAGNTIGGINLGDTQRNIRDFPSFIANRISSKPQAMTLSQSVMSDPLLLVGVLGCLGIVGALIVRRIAK